MLFHSYNVVRAPFLEMMRMPIALSVFISSRKQARSNLANLEPGNQLMTISTTADLLSPCRQYSIIIHYNISLRSNICPSVPFFATQHSPMMNEKTPRTPASSRSIIRKHSPYCESTGPIVQEGFVAARIRALQGFSNQAQIATRSHSPLTPCPPRGLHVYKVHGPPKPSVALKPVPTSTTKRFHPDILSKNHRSLASASGRLIRSSDVAPAFPTQEQQSSLEPNTPGRLIWDSAAEILSLNLFKDTVPSSHSQRNQDRVTALGTQYGSLSEVDQIDNVPVGNSSPSEKAILSPHAIQADLVEPWATWDCLPKTEHRHSDYGHEQALKPRRSIADKLGSMVEQSWVGGDPFGKVHNNDKFASPITACKFHIHDTIRNTNLDSRSYSMSEMPRLKNVPSYSGSISVSSAKTRSESQHSTGQETPLHVKQKQPRTFVYRGGSQKRRQRPSKGSPGASSVQRSSSDSGLHYLKSAPANPTAKRRAWTLHHLGHSTSNHSHIQREAPPTVWPHCAQDRRSSEQDHELMRSPPSREGSIRSIPKSDFDLTMLRDEQLGQDFAALSKIRGSRRSSSNTKASTRSASRSTSFFKKFPWYKVALVDKQTVVPDLSKEGRGNDRTSRSTRAIQHGPTFNQIELSRGVSRSHTLVERGHEEDTNAPKTLNPQTQGSIDQQAMNAVTSDYTAYSQPSLQLLKSPQGMDGRPALDGNQREPQRLQDSHATNLKITKERLIRNPPQVVKDVIGHAQSPTSTGPFGTQPRIPSESRSMDASFESPMSDNIVQSPQPQWPEVKESSRHADNRLEQSSSGSGTARRGEEFTASPDPSHQLRSQVVTLSPKRLGSLTDSLPASVHEPVRREVRGRAKGIKKVQVTVTFDGAEDLVIEARLLKKNRQEQWGTMA